MILGLCCLFALPDALAQERKPLQGEVKARFAEGERYYKAGKYEKAAEAYEAVYLLPSPSGAALVGSF
jgi:hypothetical protein